MCISICIIIINQNINMNSSSFYEKHCRRYAQTRQYHNERAHHLFCEGIRLRADALAAARARAERLMMARKRAAARRLAAARKAKVLANIKQQQASLRAARECAQGRTNSCH